VFNIQDIINLKSRMMSSATVNEWNGLEKVGIILRIVWRNLAN
jgi:hypothetical protein